MRVLKVGCSGADVVAWQTFLRGQDFMLIADGVFGPKTEEATLGFQSTLGLAETGTVDNVTLGAAMSIGFELLSDEAAVMQGPNWPPAPEDLDRQALTQAGRERVFGKFDFVPKGSAANPESIVVDPAWLAANIVSVKLPMFDGTTHMAQFHKLGAEKLLALFEAWQQAGLLERVLTFDGAFAPRFVRGSRTVLSAHAWGSAFDINARWNPLGSTPALLNKVGCVRELVELANEQGWFWGGHWRGRVDGMHFELARL